MEPDNFSEKYSVDLIGDIRGRLKSLSGFDAFIHEFIQNAEDAECSWLTFDMDQNRLEIHNDSEFDKNDWERVKTIARGGKSNDKIGTFGVGFTSVYQFTDEPTIISSGKACKFCLAKGEVVRSTVSQNRSGTTFCLPWANSQTSLRNDLDQAPVTDESIDAFWGDMPSVLPLALLFLEKLERVTFKYVDRCDKSSTITVSRADKQFIEGDCVCRTIKFEQSGCEPKCDEFLLARTCVDGESFPRSIDRQRELAIAVPIALTDAVSGRLFAFLPTQHESGLPFHIHGRFFAKSDRKGIERDGSSDNVKWNSALLNEVAPFFVKLLPGLLAELGRRKVFAVLPSGPYQCKDFSELEKIIKLVIEAEANGLLLLQNRQGHPTQGALLFQVPEGLSPSLVAVAEMCGAQFVDEGQVAPQYWMTELGVRALDLQSVASLPVLMSIERGTSLDKAPEVLQVDSLRAGLYTLINTLLPADRNADLEQCLEGLSIAVTSKRHLQPPSSLWLGDRETAELFDLLSNDDRFSSTKAMAEVPKRFARCFRRFSANDALVLLAGLAPNKFSDVFTDRVDRLAALYSQIAKWWNEAPWNRLTKTRWATVGIWQKSDGSFASAGTVSLPSEFDDPLALGCVFELNKFKKYLKSGTEEGIKELLRELGVVPIDWRTYCLKHIPEYVRSFPPEPNEYQLKKAFAVLDLLRKNLRTWQDDEEIIDAIKRLRVVPSSKDQITLAQELYLPSDQLNTAFGKGSYIVPAHLGAVVDGPPWNDLYKVLGITEIPKLDEVVERIKTLSREAFSNDRNTALLNLLQYLSENFDDIPQPDMERNVKVLADVAWIPVEGDEATLGCPSKMYVAACSPLVGSLSNCLPGYVKVCPGLVKLLRISHLPPVKLVVDRLLHLASSGEPADIVIYEYLCKNLDDPSLTALEGKKCIYIDDAHYVAGSKLYFDPVDFGKYRRVLPTKMAKWRDLFVKLGVKSSADITPEDLITLLQEVTLEFARSNLAPDTDGAAVIRTILSRLQEMQSRIAPEVKQAVQAIKDQKCLPRSDGVLETPRNLVIRDDQRFAVEFEKYLGPSLIDKSPEHWKLFHDAFGVPMLSSIVKVALTSRDGERLDHAAMHALKVRDRFIKRVIESLRRTTDKGWSIDVYHSVRITRVTTLEVRYILQGHANLPPVGPKSIGAHFDRTTSEIFLSETVALGTAEFVNALADAINPELPQRMNLTMPLLKIMAADLKTEADVAKLHQEFSYLGVDLLGEVDPRAHVVASRVVEGLDGLVPDVIAVTERDTSDSFSPTEALGLHAPNSVFSNALTVRDDTADSCLDAAEVPQSGVPIVPLRSSNDSRWIPVDGREQPPTRPRAPGIGGDSLSKRQIFKPQKFRSYVATGASSDTGEDFGEAIGESALVASEAIRLVLEWEKRQGRAPTDENIENPMNEGYDISSRGADGEVERFIEVKGTKDWAATNVSVTPAQIKFACREGPKAWLYVVADALSDSPQIYRVQNYARRIWRFGFDDGWAAVAEGNGSEVQLPNPECGMLVRLQDGRIGTVSKVYGAGSNTGVDITMEDGAALVRRVWQLGQVELCPFKEPR